MLFLLNGELSPILGAETTDVAPAPVAQEGTQAAAAAPAAGTARGTFGYVVDVRHMDSRNSGFLFFNHTPAA